ncbi:hypothetical protein LC607_17870 [Nostoc sp. CHAB 5824]|nr:hypothetical protein [Nostoc sp. CHAB 5824]
MPLQFTEQEYKLVGLYITRLLSDKLEFAENDSIKITDPQLLLELRDILETQYQDGLSAITEAQLGSDDSFSGIFEDKISSKLTKRFKFAIAGRRAAGIAPDDEISYSLLNALEVANFTEDEQLDFATKKASNCTKGIACGGSCISAKKTCRKTADAGTKKKIAEVKKKALGANVTKSATTELKESAKTGGSGAASGGDTKPPDKSKSVNKVADVKRSRSSKNDVPDAEKERIALEADKKKSKMTEKTPEYITKNFEQNLKEVTDLRSAGEKEVNIQIAGAIDRADALRRSVASGRPQSIAESLPEAITKLRDSSDDSPIGKFSKATLEYARLQYDKLPEEFKREWANNQYTGFKKFGKFNQQLYDNFANKSLTHKTIADDLKKYVD